VPLPEDLSVHYGLTTELLYELFQSAQICLNQVNPVWCLLGIPNVGFYRKLHLFLRKWDKTKSATKTSIGKLYLYIDRQLQQEKDNPMSAFKFIERAISSSMLDLELMPYSRLTQLEGKLHATEGEVNNLAGILQQQENELSCMKRNFEEVERELIQAKQLLSEVKRENEVLQKQKLLAHKKANQIYDLYKGSISDLICVEDKLLTKSNESEELMQEQKIGASMQDSTLALCNFQIKEGNKTYSHAIRQLYYSLLADQIAPAKIPRAVTAVLNCFLPSVNTTSLQLPHERCAGYMRRELHTISTAHKACSLISCKTLNANSDGTTKFQKKLGGVAVNGMVLCLGEVPDGSAESMIELIEAELEKIRKTACDLKLSNPEKINWTLFTSSTSDSASSQKKFNRLVKECQQKDRMKYGPPSAEATELIENLCAMHLGSNLRKAFLDGTKNVAFNDADQQGGAKSQREHYSTDTFIHEFCKLFGRQGVPEYGCGIIYFPDFLSLQLSNRQLEASVTSYYQSCLEVQLERQVGSRYFVSACNACKILYLIKAAKDFLEYTGKDNGNNLETTVYNKLQNADEVSQLTADAIMFYFVYADLVTLAKSNKLNKSAFDMNQHYFELHNFLEKVEQNPETVVNKDYNVFSSEDRLYGSDKDINHRIRSKNLAIYKHLFQTDDWDTGLLFPLLSTGASKMKEKLSDYAKAQLPGGKYWNPKPSVTTVLKALKPSNDICESILGLNDFLTTAVPNMHQITRSNLVEVKKNGTMKWLQELSPGMKQTVTTKAMKMRQEVMRQCHEEEIIRSKHRQENMEHSYQRRIIMKEKAVKERQHLSQQHLITTTFELNEALDEINSDVNSTSSKKSKQSLSLIRMQINIRKKVLNQKVNIPFSHKGKQRPLSDIVTDITEFIAAHTQTSEMNSSALMIQPDVSDPTSLIGREIQHRFKLASGKFKWFSGVIISYNAKNKTHEIAYDGEIDHCYFNLVNDIRDGDLKIVT